MTAPRILMVATSHDRIDADHPTGVWYEELATPYRLFREEGAEVTVASPAGGRIPVDPRSAPEAPEGDSAWEAIQDTPALEGLDSADFDALFLPGGHGTMFDFPDDGRLRRLVEDMAAQDKVVGAVCHGPAALVHAEGSEGQPLVAGRRVTAFTNSEERAVELDGLMPFLLQTRLEELGAEFVTAEDWQEHVERDGLLVTGQNPQSSEAGARQVLEALQEGGGR